MTLNDDVIVGGVIAAMIGFFSWIVKAAARQALDGFKEALSRHAQAIEHLTEEVVTLREEMGEFRGRIKSVEDRLQ